MTRPATETSGDFVNPYADDDPDRAQAYRDGYREGAFGGHGTQPPDSLDAELADIWQQGNNAGHDRYEAYKKGFDAGVNAALAQDPAPDPPFAPGDLAAGWTHGRDDGLRHGLQVAETIQAKALETEHFEHGDWPIHHKRLPGGGWRYWQEYDGKQRCIFVQVPGDLPGDAYAVDAPIYQAYQDLGGAEGVLGLPVGDTTPVPDGRGRYTMFRKGEIYATATTLGVVHGRIAQHWHDLGPAGTQGPRGPFSYLGYPTNRQWDNLDDGGRGTTFEGGDIYWWPGEPDPVDLAGIAIRYRGMNCFGDTDEAFADEAYPIFTILGPLRRNLDGSYTADERTHAILGPEQNAVGGGSYPQNMEIYRGAIGDVGGVAVRLMEHDSGDENAYRASVEAAVRTALGAAAGAIAATGVGLPVAALAAWLLQAGAGPIANAINEALGTGDDTIGSTVFSKTPHELYQLARDGGRAHEQDIEYQFGHEVLLSGHGGSYKTYFDVVLI
jgi:hypothetical protein